jgi:peptide/nickel transport system permease protein
MTDQALLDEQVADELALRTTPPATVPGGALLEPHPGGGASTADPAPSHQHPFSRAARFLLRRPGLVVSCVILAAVVTAAFWPALFTSQDPLASNPSANFAPPSAEHIFGTDELGRDLFARVVYGAELSLQATLIAVGVAFLIGGSIGLIAGFVGGRVEGALMRVIDVLLSIPGLLLSLALVSAMGYGTLKVALAVGIASLAGFARVMRSEVLRVRQAVYVEAARAIGARWYRVLGHHVLPNSFGPVLVLATLDVGTSVLAVASLSFLGYGAAPPAPEWGTLVADGRNYLAIAWWLTVLPGAVIAATVLSINRIGRALDGERAVAR